MKTIKDQKSVADSILIGLETIDPDAICAGGAPRDWSMKKIANDLDFYFYPRVDVPVDYMIAMLDYTGIMDNRDYDIGFAERNTLPVEYTKNPYLKRMITFGKGDDHIQIMEMTEPVKTSVVPTFPITLSMISYKNGQLMPTEQFMDAIVNREIRIVNNGYGNSKKYIEKIIRRFPDFTVVREEGVQ